MSFIRIINMFEDLEEFHEIHSHPLFRVIYNIRIITFLQTFE